VGGPFARFQNRPSACIFQASQDLRRDERSMRWLKTS
jgi:hypothetical protein